MINIYIAYDENESNFKRLAENLKSRFIGNKAYQIQLISNQNLNESYIHQLLSKQDESEIYIFAAYSHGLEDRLLVRDGDFRSYTNTRTAPDYRGSVFYTFSCSTSLELANAMISNGALCYFGYKGKVHFLREDKFITANVDIVNSGLIKLLKEGVFDQSAFESAKNEILESYDLYIKNESDLGFMKQWTQNLLLLDLKLKR